MDNSLYLIAIGNSEHDKSIDVHTNLFSQLTAPVNDVDLVHDLFVGGDLAIIPENNAHRWVDLSSFEIRQKFNEFLHSLSTEGETVIF